MSDDDLVRVLIDPATDKDTATAIKAHLTNNGIVIIDDLWEIKRVNALYNNPESLRMYRTLIKDQGLPKDAARKTVELMTGDVMKTPNSGGFWVGKTNLKEHELPYYHGPKRRF